MSKSTILRKIRFKASDFIKQEDGICLLGVSLDCNQAKMAIFGAGSASETRIALPKLIRGVLEKMDSIDKAKLKEAIREEIFDEEDEGND